MSLFYSSIILLLKIAAMLLKRRLPVLPGELLSPLSFRPDRSSYHPLETLKHILSQSKQIDQLEYQWKNTQRMSKAIPRNDMAVI